MKHFLTALALVFAFSMSVLADETETVQRYYDEATIESIDEVKIVEKFVDPKQLSFSYMVIELRGVYDTGGSEEAVALRLEDRANQDVFDPTTAIKVGKFYLTKESKDPIGITGSNFGFGSSSRKFSVKLKLHPAVTEATNRSAFHVTFEVPKNEPFRHTRLRGFEATLQHDLKRWDFNEINSAKNF